MLTTPLQVLSACYTFQATLASCIFPNKYRAYRLDTLRVLATLARNNGCQHQYSGVSIEKVGRSYIILQCHSSFFSSLSLVWNWTRVSWLDAAPIADVLDARGLPVIRPSSPICLIQPLLVLRDDRPFNMYPPCTIAHPKIAGGLVKVRNIRDQATEIWNTSNA